MNTELTGFPRADGRKGIRNVVVIAYLVECAHHVARAVAASFGESGSLGSSDGVGGRSRGSGRDECCMPNIRAASFTARD